MTTRGALAILVSQLGGHPMAKKVRTPQKPKPRNWVAKSVRDLDGPYRPRAERDRTKFTRKKKHKKEVDNDPS